MVQREELLAKAEDIADQVGIHFSYRLTQITDGFYDYHRFYDSTARSRTL